MNAPMPLQRTPFAKLLIANRGEIAVRVIRSARAQGIATVAVYSEPEADAPHVALADEAVCIGPAAPRRSYLRIDAIIDAARLTGADAIHPGYGFLAENEGLPAACAEAGIVFVGPSAEAIRAMGNKAGAKRLMIEAGVPCVPGYEGAAQDEATLAGEAERSADTDQRPGRRQHQADEAEKEALDHEADDAMKTLDV